MFPSNRFNQEPMTNPQIKEWNSKNEGVNFTIFKRIAVNGACTHPLYKYMKSKKSGWFGSAIKWNYTKFLIDRKGIPVKRYGPNEAPYSAEDDIKAELKKKVKDSTRDSI
jgi:glutathione peroxidase